MKFDLIGLSMNQFVLLFIAVFIGFYIGKILRIGVSGCLFSGLLLGWAITKWAQNIVVTADLHVGAANKLLQINVIDKIFFTFSIILFVTAIGFLAADKLGFVVKKYGIKFILLGFLITFSGAATTYLLTALSGNFNPYEVSGVYTGALTSSPGLAAAIETTKDSARELAENYTDLNERKKEEILTILGDYNAEDASQKLKLTQAEIDEFVVKSEAAVGVGHAIGYPFGVIIVILAMRFFPLLFRMNIKEEYDKFNAEMALASERNAEDPGFIPVSFDIGAFCFACTLGYLLGSLKIFLGPLGYFSLGATGGALVVPLLLGCVGKIGFMNFRMDKKILGAVRELALAFFLAIVGLRYGFAVIDALVSSGIYLAFVALVVGLIAMMLGFVVGRYVFKINWIMLCGAICGGMTSTPGLGAAIDALDNDDPAAGYGATYPFALFGMVLFTIILHRIPM